MVQEPGLKFKKTVYIIILGLALSVSFLLCPSKASADSPNSLYKSQSIEIKEGWQYRLGDSSLNNQGLPVWALDSTDDQAWSNFSHLSKPSDSKGYRNFWLRIKLPDTTSNNSNLYIKTLNQALEVYFEGKSIYEFSSVKSPNRRKILGYSNHTIPISKDFQGKYVYFRVFSYDQNTIGLFRDFRLGSEADITKYIFEKDSPQVVISVIFIFIGLILIALFIQIFRKEKSLFSLGFFSICIGVWSFTRTDIKLFFYNSPPVWFYIDVLSLYLVPVGFCAFVVQIFKVKNELILKYLWQFFILNEILVIILDITNIVPLYMTLGPYFVLLTITMIIIAYSVVRIALKGDIDAIIFAVGVIFLSVSGAYDIIGEYLRAIPWHTYMTPRGMFIFILSLSIILGRHLLDVYNRLKTHSNEIEIKNEALNHMFLEIKNSKEKIARWSEGLEQVVMEKTASIRNLLDNAGQGFLTFGKGLAVDREYSNECVKIFGDKIGNKNFADLIFPDDNEQKIFMTSITEKILVENDISKRDILLSLIPDEALINNKHIHISYKVINSKEENSCALMVILTDITERRILEQQMEAERNNLKMVVKVVVSHNDFSECTKDYKNFYCFKIHELLNSKLPLEDILYEIFRNVHTFKGSFSQLNMLNAVIYLNELENVISDLCKNIKNTTHADVKNIILSLNIDEWLDKDLQILKNILGEQFFKLENTIKIDKAKLIEIENKLIASLSPFQCRFLLPHIKMLRYTPFNELLKSYPEYIMRLSDQVEKLVNSPVIEGGDFPVDADIYYSFTRSLVHVFRNIIDHGIEPIEERISRNKSEYGNIKCIASVLNGGKISLTISDDGHGIDTNQILEKALKSGLIDEEGSDSLTREEILNLIFKQGFTTKEFASDISGRGIGLYAVKREVDSLGGTIEVKAEEGYGTEFRFVLPYEELFGLPDIASINEYLSPIAEVTKKIFNEQTGLILEDRYGNEAKKVESVPLKDVTVFINVKGLLDGTFIMSADDSLVKDIIQSYITYNSIMYNLPEDDSIFIPEDVLSEFFNMVLGNSMKMFTDTENLITIDSPVTVSSNKNSILKYPGSEIWTTSLACHNDTLSLTFMTSKDLS